jgi:replication factor C subunit 1
MSVGDRGGLQALAKFIVGSRIPVICICNDRYDRKLEPIGRRLAVDVPFDSPTKMEVARRVNTICKAENISLSRSQYHTVTEMSGGDVRSAVNNLQLWGTSISNASGKDARRFDPLGASLDLIKPGTAFERRMDDFFIDYDTVPEYVHDNLSFTNRFEEWEAALDAMASGNELTHAVHETNQWGLLPAIGACSCVLPAVLVPQTRMLGGRGFSFVPVAFGKLSKLNKGLRILSEISLKCSRGCLVPRAAFRDGIAELLTFKFYDMLQRSREMELVALLGTLEMTKDDVVGLREIVDFGVGVFPDSKVLQASFTRRFNSVHSQPHSSAGDSFDSQRADYFVVKSPTSKKKSS